MMIGVLLSGSGVYDGSEIHEATFTLYSIMKNGGDYLCMAPNKDQYHVVDHITGEEQDQTRNTLVESARISRGNIQAVDKVNFDLLDALVIPGGFGAAKNLNQWAIEGPEGEIDPDVKKLIVDMIGAGKPVVGLCMGPTVIAKALQGTGWQVKLTVGTTEEESPYEIAEISQGMEDIGMSIEMRSVKEILYDSDNKVITAPCYMMDADITDVFDNVEMAINKLFEVLKEDGVE